MVSCVNCGRRALIRWDDRIPFCLDCAEKMSQIAARPQQEQLLESIQRRQMMNFILEQAEGMSAGPPGFLGRFPIPEIPPRTIKGNITLNNISIDRSTIGILNTGQIQQIDLNISKLSQRNQIDIAEALKVLTSAIASTQGLSAEGRNELVEQLHELSDQAVLRPNQRKLGVIRAIIAGLSSSLNSVSALATIWATWGDTIRTYFGL